MTYTSNQISLLIQAAKLTSLGYTIGLSKNKNLVKNYEVEHYNSQINYGDWDSLSVILTDMVCVDFDIPDLDLGWHFLPPTWKERSPRGFHLFYKLDSTHVEMRAKIKWRKNVDLLIKEIKSSTSKKKYSSYEQESDDGFIFVEANDQKVESQPPNKTKPYVGHVLISPSSGYKRIWPEICIPEKNKLTPAPEWLVDALLK